MDPLFPYTTLFRSEGKFSSCLAACGQSTKAAVSQQIAAGMMRCLVPVWCGDLNAHVAHSMLMLREFTRFCSHPAHQRSCEKSNMYTDASEQGLGRSLKNQNLEVTDRKSTRLNSSN